MQNETFNESNEDSENQNVPELAQNEYDLEIQNKPLLLHFFHKWRRKTIIQLLARLQEKKMNELISFSQQIHLYNQEMYFIQCRLKPNIDINDLEKLSDSEIALWTQKRNFPITEESIFYDNRYMLTDDYQSQNEKSISSETIQKPNVSTPINDNKLTEYQMEFQHNAEDAMKETDDSSTKSENENLHCIISEKKENDDDLQAMNIQTNENSKDKSEEQDLSKQENEIFNSLELNCEMIRQSRKNLKKIHNSIIEMECKMEEKKMEQKMDTSISSLVIPQETSEIHYHDKIQHDSNNESNSESDSSEKELTSSEENSFSGTLMSNNNARNVQSGKNEAEKQQQNEASIENSLTKISPDKNGTEKNSNSIRKQGMSGCKNKFIDEMLDNNNLVNKKDTGIVSKIIIKERIELFPGFILIGQSTDL